MKHEIVYLSCDRCGNQERNHSILSEHIQRIGEEDGMDIRQFNQIVKCLGCDTVRFYRYYLSPDITYEGTNELEEWDCELFPHESEPVHKSIDTTSLPDTVSHIYRETVLCVNSGAITLAGGGLRAIVEAICNDRNVVGSNLKSRINKLVESAVLAKSQADLLHEERLIGNDALHNMKTPSNEDIEDCLRIIEGLLMTIYTIPLHGERLKVSRGKLPEGTSIPKTNEPS